MFTALGKVKCSPFWGPGLPRRDMWAALDEHVLQEAEGLASLILQKRKRKRKCIHWCSKRGREARNDHINDCRVVHRICRGTWDLHPKEGHWPCSRKINLGNTGWISTPFGIWNNKIYYSCIVSRVVREYKKQETFSVPKDCQDFWEDCINRWKSANHGVYIWHRMGNRWMLIGTSA